jgi:uncharacterized protein YozE (UPF0346 family)
MTKPSDQQAFNAYLMKEKKNVSKYLESKMDKAMYIEHSFKQQQEDEI